MSHPPADPKDKNWPHDNFAKSEVASQVWLVWAGAAVLLIAVLSTIVFSRCTGDQPFVVAYCAQDQVYAKPIFREFENQTGIAVRPVFDSEAVKTVGLANRLLAEKDNPQCDVFWGNEELRTRQLAARDVFRATNGWASFGYRTRRIVINTNLLGIAEAPKSLLELTNTAWRGKVALAYPLFGTTSTHFHALRQHWGSPTWENWCRALAANKPLLLDGNSVVVNLVGRGEAPLGLTDSDDIAAGQREKQPVVELPLGLESLLIPNTVGVIRNAPHPDAAQRLFEFLQRREIAQKLVDARALEGVSAGDLQPNTLRPSWDALLKDLDQTTETLRGIFLK